MRARIWFFGPAFAAAVVIAFFTLSGAVPAPPAKPEPPAPQDDRDAMAAKLMARVTIDKALADVPLKDVLEMLSEKHDLTILIDKKSFGDGAPLAAAVNAQDNAVLDKPISIPAVKKVRLATIFKMVGDQIGGGYLLYPDHIKFVGAGKLETLTNPLPKNFGVPEDPEAPESRENIVLSIPLVNVNFEDRPLRDALRDVEIRTNRSIALAPQANDRGNIPIKTRFTNVPVDSAVATLAEMAGLKMARKGNVLLVTTVERAKEFEPPPPAPLFGLNNLNNLLPNNLLPNNSPQTPDAQVEELKKKVAELEKTIAELKKEKK